MWWWQFECSDEWAPDFITKFGCDVKSKSIQEDEWLSMWVGWFMIFLSLYWWVGWFIICLSPYWEVRFAILEPSVVVLSFLYHWLNFVLKSPSAITKNGFVSKILSRISSKLFVNVSNSSWDWLGDLYEDKILQNLLPFLQIENIQYF